MTTFAAASRRLAGLAGVLLGWSPDAFWRATPDELTAVFDALRGEAETAPPAPDDLARLREMYPDG